MWLVRNWRVRVAEPSDKWHHWRGQLGEPDNAGSRWWGSGGAGIRCRAQRDIRGSHTTLLTTAVGPSGGLDFADPGGSGGEAQCDEALKWAPTDLRLSADREAVRIPTISRSFTTAHDNLLDG